MTRSTALWVAGFVFCTAGCGAGTTSAADVANAQRHTPSATMAKNAERMEPASLRLQRSSAANMGSSTTSASATEQAPITAQRTPPRMPTASAARVHEEAVVHMMTTDVNLARQSVESDDFIQALRDAGATAPPTLTMIDHPRVAGSNAQPPLAIWVDVQQTRRARPGEVTTVYHWVDWNQIQKRVDNGAAIVIQVASKDPDGMMRFLQSDDFTALLQRSGIDQKPPVQAVDEVVYGAIR